MADGAHREESLPAESQSGRAGTAPSAGTLGAQARDAWRQVLDLLSARRHPMAVRRARAALIGRRVRLIALLLGILTLAWIAIDIATIPAPAWAEIMAGRVLAAIAFFACAAPQAARLHARPVAAVAALVGVSLAFFLYANVVLAAAGQLDTLAVGTAYFYLPFILAAGLSVFPLTALEAALPAVLAVGGMALALEIWPHFLGGQSATATLWRLVVIAGIAVLAGMSQLRFILLLTSAATRDGLTGLLGRRVGEELLEMQFAYAVRHDLPFSLLFIDLDRFKAINDQFGHKIGDEVLASVGRVLAGAFRRQDVLIRWGGEEFVVGLPGTDGASAEASVQRLAGIGFGARPDGQPVTASFGIAERKADGAERLRSLIERADERMYRAKQAGRNRVCFQGPPAPWLRPPARAA